MFAMRAATTRFALTAAKSANKSTNLGALGASTRSIVSIAEATKMPKYFCDMDNDTIIRLAGTNNEDAINERLIRNIMSVDQVNWEDAQPRFKEIAEENEAGMSFFVLPYQIGFTVAVGAGLASFPLCFHEGTALLFNEYMVTTDVPDAKDLETVLEIGAWSWNWMEPPLGQISFFLLTLQFARSQMENMGIKPYTGWLKRSRADKLYSKYPQYTEHIVKDYSFSIPLLGGTILGGENA
jgi:hypothetical protein